MSNTINIKTRYTLIPEGRHIFRIYDVEYEPEFGKIVIKLINSQGQIYIERFFILTIDNEPNDSVINAFSYFAKTAINDFTLEDIDPKVLIDKYISATLFHYIVEPNEINNYEKPVTYMRLKDFEYAEGFDPDSNPVNKALNFGKNKKVKKEELSTNMKKGLDLDELLG